MKSPEPISSETKPQGHILVVDDEAPIRELLETYLRKHRYRVSTAATENEMFDLLKRQPAELIILDVLLQDSDGLELLAKLRRQRYRCPVIMITGLGPDDELKRRALAKGANECVSKSSPLEELLAVVERTLATTTAAAPARPPGNQRVRRTHQTVSLKLPPSHDKVEDAPTVARTTTSAEATPTPLTPRTPRETNQAATAASPEASSEEFAGSTIQQPSGIAAAPGVIARLATLTPEASRVEFGVEVFLRMLAAYHPNVANTSMRALVLCKAVGEQLQMPETQLQHLLWAAALQDIALVRLPKELLNRWLRSPDKCTKEEWIVIKRHPVQAQQMLESWAPFKEAGEIVAAHHENWDGSGYPSGLRMEMIPWLGRLLSVVTDYCSRHRPNEKTVREIEAQANQRFDSQAVQAFVQAVASTPLPRGERELIASSLRPGMVLAADIVNWDGVLILGHGTELSNSGITKVLHLSQAGQIEPRVLVYC